MLPANAPAALVGGNNQTNNSFSDRHSIVSGTAPNVHDPSDVDFLSINGGGGAPSEAGSLFENTPNISAAADKKRALAAAYDDLFKIIKGKSDRRNTLVPHAAPPVDILHEETT